MIDAELVERATPLLSTAMAELVEDKHLARVIARDSDPAPSGSLLQLGCDITVLAATLGVILHRAEPST